MLRPITTSTYSFPDVIGNGFVYVDKTELIRELLRDGKNQYFCALSDSAGANNGVH